jgi:hypothetical protein
MAVTESEIAELRRRIAVLEALVRQLQGQVKALTP